MRIVWLLEKLRCSYTSISGAKSILCPTPSGLVNLTVRTCQCPAFSLTATIHTYAHTHTIKTKVHTEGDSDDRLTSILWRKLMCWTFKIYCNLNWSERGMVLGCVSFICVYVNHRLQPSWTNSLCSAKLKRKKYIYSPSPSLYEYLALVC